MSTENHKGNPVPSIVKDLNHVCAWYQGRDVDACERVEAYAKSLQNGVETNKEYPELTVSGKRRELVG